MHSGSSLETELECVTQRPRFKTSIPRLLYSATLYQKSAKWVLSHVGIPGNERADQKVKQGAESSQLKVPLILRRSKSIIFIYIDKHTVVTPKYKSLGKPWESMAIVGLISRHLEKAEANYPLSPNHQT
ncbi:uncharacterized protein TNCV_494011 [Trichonephila clavipes]|nr:uncharacterized protein TNCV_494011 [Trichonephila clavipes]